MFGFIPSQMCLEWGEAIYDGNGIQSEQMWMKSNVWNDKVVGSFRA